MRAGVRALRVRCSASPIWIELLELANGPECNAVGGSVHELNQGNESPRTIVKGKNGMQNIRKESAA